MYQEHGFDDAGVEEQLQFLDDHQDRLNELSLRMALKVADLRKVSNHNWRDIAEMTCMRRR